MGNLSQHFSSHEFICPCALCHNIAPLIDLALVDALEKLRAILARPLRILSGYRCRSHNANVSGSPTSQHCLGRAADLAAPLDLSPDAMADAASHVPAFRHGGIGVYSWGIHVDVRTTGAARWVG